MEEQKITEKPQMPSVKAVITLPLDYRARLNMMRVQFGYKHAGQLVMQWIDEAAKRTGTTL